MKRVGSVFAEEIGVLQDMHFPNGKGFYCFRQQGNICHWENAKHEDK